MTAFAFPGLLQVPSAIIRGTQEGGSVKTVVVSVVVIIMVCAPYVYFTLVQHEESTEIAWMRRSDSDQTRVDEQRQ